MILLLQPPKEINIQELDESLEKCCGKLEVTYTLRAATPTSDPSPVDAGCVGSLSSIDKVIITVIGADRIGIVAGVTEALVEVDDCIDMPALRSTLEDCAQSLSVEINVQSQEIFNAMSPGQESLLAGRLPDNWMLPSKLWIYPWLPRRKLGIR